MPHLRQYIRFPDTLYHSCRKCTAALPATDPRFFHFLRTIRQSDRKAHVYVEHKADRRTLLTTFGNLQIERAYYKPKNGGKSVYFLDKYVGLAPHDKVSLAVKTKFVEEAVETSYQKGGENKIDLIVRGYCVRRNGRLQTS